MVREQRKEELMESIGADLAQLGIDRPVVYPQQGDKEIQIEDLPFTALRVIKGTLHRILSGKGEGIEAVFIDPDPVDRLRLTRDG